jgi:AbrB family looped-hinge helix DNA binding protein
VRITTKGQVTIPQEIRERLGLLPYTEVEFEVVDDWVRLRKAKPTDPVGPRGRAVLAALRGSARGGMTTDEIMALTRGEDDRADHGG